MRFTVFTPTYNRGNIIEKLYRSLQRQTYGDFEWVVVDDCSTDDTKELFAAWQNCENGFDIIYVYKEKNGGKHRAINAGVEIARGDLFFIVDSDDYLIDDALEKADKWVRGLPEDKKFAGVAGLRGYAADKPIGTGPSGAYMDCTSLEREKNNIFGDKAEVFFTDILKAYPFPEYEGENFIPEGVVWFKIAHDGYKIRWTNEIIYIGEYLAEGLTKNSRKKREANPRGTMHIAKTYLDYAELRLIQRMRYASLYCSAARKTGMKLGEISKELRLSKSFLRLSILLRKMSKLLGK